MVRGHEGLAVGLPREIRAECWEGELALACHLHTVCFDRVWVNSDSNRTISLMHCSASG